MMGYVRIPDHDSALEGHVLTTSHIAKPSYASSFLHAIVELTSLNREDALRRMFEAHQRGLTLLLSTHREHAELLQEQFSSKRLTVTIERA